MIVDNRIKQYNLRLRKRFKWETILRHEDRITLAIQIRREQGRQL